MDQIFDAAAWSAMPLDNHAPQKSSILLYKRNSGIENCITLWLILLDIASCIDILYYVS